MLLVDIELSLTIVGVFAIKNYKSIGPQSGVLYDLANAPVDRYDNTTDKRARYRPKNRDIKPLGDAKFEKITFAIHKQIEKQRAWMAA